MSICVQHIPTSNDLVGPAEKLVRWVRTVLVAVARDLGRLAGRSGFGSKETEFVELDGHDCFVAELDLPAAPWSKHEQAIRLRAHEISPIDPDLTILVAKLKQVSDGLSTYEIAIADAHKLAAIETVRRNEGVRRVCFTPAGRPDIVLVSAQSETSARKGTLTIGISALLLLLIAAVGNWAVQSWLADVYMAQLVEERAQRLQLRRAGQALEQAEQLAHDVETVLVPGSPERLALELADIAAGLPSGLVIERMDWSRDGIELIVRREAGGDDEPITLPAGWNVSPEQGPLAAGATMTIRIGRGPA